MHGMVDRIAFLSSGLIQRDLRKRLTSGRVGSSPTPSTMTKKDYILPVSIVLGCFILGLFFYLSQVEKQESIERQQELKSQQDKEKELFENNLKCNNVLTDLKKRWNNVVGISYSPYMKTCMVKFMKNGEVEQAALEDMQDQ